MLLYQPNAQYEMHINIKDVAPTYFGAGVPTSGNTILQF